MFRSGVLKFRKTTILSHFAILFFSTINIAEAQLEGNNWTWGRGFGLNFSTFPPTQFKSQVYYNDEMCVTFSSKADGRLLFYAAPDCRQSVIPYRTVVIYDSSHNIVPSGSHLQGWYSAHQGLLVVPAPDQNERYYLFYVDAMGAGLCPGKQSAPPPEGNRLWWSAIERDPRTNGLKVTTKNQVVRGLPPLAEGVTGTINCNGEDYWVVVSHRDSSIVYSIPITKNGVESSKVVASQLDPRWNPLRFESACIKKISPDGRYLASNQLYVHEPKSLSSFWVHEFDNRTGGVTNGRPLGNYGLTWKPTSVTFSPSSNRLYFCSVNFIDQYSLDTATGVFEPTAKIDRFSQFSSVLNQYSMQMAPGGKIFTSGEYFRVDTMPSGTILVDHRSAIGCMIEPDSLLTRENFKADLILMPTSDIDPPRGFDDVSNHFPNFMDYIFSSKGPTEAVRCALPKVSLTPQSVCAGQWREFQVQSDQPLQRWTWTFNGTSPRTASDERPRRTFLTPGTYTVSVSACNENGCDTASTTVTVFPRVPLVAEGDTSLCTGGQAQLRASGAMTYRWSPAQTLSDSTSATPIATPLLTTRYYVVATDSNGCTRTDSVLVSVGELTVQTSNDTVVCGGASVQLMASGGASYSWSPASGLDRTDVSNPIASPAQTTLYRVEVRAGACVGYDSVLVTVAPDLALVRSADTAVCAGSPVRLQARGGTRYRWEPAWAFADPSASVQVFTPDATRRYTVTAWNEQGCSASDSILVSVEALPELACLLEIKVAQY